MRVGTDAGSPKRQSGELPKFHGVQLVRGKRLGTEGAIPFRQMSERDM